MPPTTTQALQRWLDRHCAQATFTLAAQYLGISERTLSRRLAEEGSSFRQLLDDTRQRKALDRLGEAPPERLAAELGYAGRRPLLRAFRRWTGITLGQWLAQQEGDIPRHHGQNEAPLNIVQPRSNEDARES